MHRESVPKTYRLELQAFNGRPQSVKEHHLRIITFLNNFKGILRWIHYTAIHLNRIDRQVSKLHRIRRKCIVTPRHGVVVDLVDAPNDIWRWISVQHRRHNHTQAGLPPYPRHWRVVFIEQRIIRTLALKEKRQVAVWIPLTAEV